MGNSGSMSYGQVYVQHLSPEDLHRLNVSLFERAEAKPDPRKVEEREATFDDYLNEEVDTEDTDGAMPNNVTQLTGVESDKQDEGHGSPEKNPELEAAAVATTACPVAQTTNRCPNGHIKDSSSLWNGACTCGKCQRDTCVFNCTKRMYKLVCLADKSMLCSHQTYLCHNCGRCIPGMCPYLDSGTYCEDCGHNLNFAENC